MRRHIIALLCFAAISCSHKKNDFDNNPNMRGSFNVEKTADTPLVQKSCDTQKLDERLKEGLIFSNVETYKDIESADITVSYSDKTIQSIDREHNVIMSKVDFKDRKMNGWFITKTQFEQAEGWTSSKTDVVDVAPHLKNIFIHSQEEDKKDHEWISCIINKPDTSEETTEDGVFTLADKKEIKAQRHIYTQKGDMECVKMKSSNEGTDVQEISREKVGKGTISTVSITTQDLPAVSLSCDKALTALYYKYEVLSDDKKFHSTNSDELTSIH